MKKVITRKYEYDDQGNLIKETVIEETIITEPKFDEVPLLKDVFSA